MSARHENYANCVTCGEVFRYPDSRKNPKFCSGKCVNRKLLSALTLEKMSEGQRNRDWAKKRSLDNIKKRFYALFEITDSCWIWIGNRKSTGYGRFYYSKDVKSITSHRASWLIHNGEIENNMHVLHKCDNPSCVNPEHLFLGTHEDNMVDRSQKKRTYIMQGTTNHQSKLTDEKVREIRRLYPEYSSYKLAAMYGVDRVLINRIVKRTAWSHVE